jgi:uncharacterized protein involved in exopolysaccharide biosynthesis
VLDDAVNNSRDRAHPSEIYNTFGQLSLSDIIDFILRYAILFIATTVAALGAATFYIVTAPNLYTAAGQILIDVKVPQIADEQWREAGINLDTAQVESQINVLRSQHIARAVIKRLDLMSDPEFRALAQSHKASPASAEKPPVTSESNQPKSKAGGFEDPERALLFNAARLLQSNLAIRRLGLAYVLEVAHTSPDPTQAARIANGVMEAYIADQVAIRSEAARQGSEWLERRIGSLRVQMNEASRRVQEFKARRDYSIGARTTQDPKTADTHWAGQGETLEELEATAMTYRKMFESALQAYTEAEQRQSYPVGNARVISFATPPETKSSPKRKEAIAIAVVMGLLLSVGLALLREGIIHARRIRATAGTARAS